MTAEAHAVTAPEAPPARPRRARLLRWVGWTLVTAGSVVLLYLAYSLLFTNLETSRAQAELLETWEREVVAPATPAAGDGAPATGTGGQRPDPAVRPGGGEAGGADLGTAVAMIEFLRPGSDDRPVQDEPLLVVAGVSAEALRAGPGHYPGTALPGAEGNVAVAGHRTTYGAPFFGLDELEPGDRIHATGRDGVRHVYEVVHEEVVGPADTWVIEPDPLATGRPTLTLTTCHPRFSAAQRLVVFAELVR